MKINSHFFSLLIRQIYFSNIHPNINKFLLYHAIQDIGLRIISNIGIYERKALGSILFCVDKERQMVGPLKKAKRIKTSV